MPADEPLHDAIDRYLQRQRARGSAPEHPLLGTLEAYPESRPRPDPLREPADAIALADALSDTFDAFLAGHRRFTTGDAMHVLVFFAAQFLAAPPTDGLTGAQVRARYDGYGQRLAWMCAAFDDWATRNA